MKMACALGACALVGLAATANADVVTYDGGLPMQSGANWTKTSALPQWNPVLFPGQTLTGVTLTLRAQVSGTSRGENEDTLVGTTLTLHLSGTITVNVVDASSNPLGLTAAGSPDVVNTFVAGTYDGASDFGGTSGVTFANLFGETTGTGSIGNIAALLAPFIGSGNLTAVISSLGNSGVTSSNSGDFSQFSTTRTGSLLSITYTYVPAPSAGAALAVGLFASARRRRG